jgi:hypothetical protein
VQSSAQALHLRESALPYLLQGIAFTRLGRWADAEWALQGAVALEVRNAEHLRTLSIILICLQPTLPLSSYFLSEVHLKAQDLSAAESDAKYEEDNCRWLDAVQYQLARVSVAEKALDTAKARRDTSLSHTYSSRRIPIHPDAAVRSAVYPRQPRATGILEFAREDDEAQVIVPRHCLQRRVHACNVKH